jgi:hypothetical protein
MSIFLANKTQALVFHHQAFLSKPHTVYVGRVCPAGVCWIGRFEMKRIWSDFKILLRDLIIKSHPSMI